MLNVGWVPGISTLQTLGRAGVSVHAVDHRHDALGFRSRYASARHLSPRRLDEEDAWIDFLAALGVFCWRKLLQDPPGVGTARVAEARWVDDVVGQGLALLRGLRFHGVSQVGFKRDPRDGAYKLMEINPLSRVAHLRRARRRSQ